MPGMDVGLKGWCCAVLCTLLFLSVFDYSRLFWDGHVLQQISESDLAKHSLKKQTCRESCSLVVSVLLWEMETRSSHVLYL